MIGLVGSHVIDQPFDRVHLRVGEADVEVEAVEDLAQINVNLRGFGGGVFEPVVTDGELRFDYPCDDLCGGTIRLQIPPNTPLDLSIGAGDLWVTGMSSTVHAEVGGRVGVVAHSGSEVIVTSTTVGRVEVSLDEPADHVSVHNVQGPIAIELPAGAYALELEATQTVTLDPSIEVDPKSTFVVTGVADAGAIAVYAR